MANSQEERAHWTSVLKAYDDYMQYHLSANHARRLAFLSLPLESKAIYARLGYREKLDAVDEGIRRNAEFIEQMLADPVFGDMLAEADNGIGSPAEPTAPNGGHSHSQSYSTIAPSTHTFTSGPSATIASSSSDRSLAQDKVRSTLRSFVREWSVEGADERRQCYEPCVEALERRYPGRNDVLSQNRDRRDVRVLVPGCGLGRLAMEIAAKGRYLRKTAFEQDSLTTSTGFASQGNEFSTYMLLASHFVLNQTTRSESHVILPYLHSFSNHPTTSSHLLRRVMIPDVCPSNVLAIDLSANFSLVAGDFEEVYGPRSWESARSAEAIQADEENLSQRGRWGAVVTCFFIDCARDILNFLRIIYNILEDDGVWINIGPLLWHYENSPTASDTGEGSIELSLDEVKRLATMIGFEIRDERMIKSTYNAMPGSMLESEYNAAFWTATKRNPSTVPFSEAVAETPAVGQDDVKVVKHEEP